MSLPKSPRPKRVECRHVTEKLEPLPRVSNYARYLKYCRQTKSDKTRIVDYIYYMENLLGHEPRTKYWVFKRSRMAQKMAEVWEKSGSHSFMNYRHMKVFLWIARRMSLENEYQYWPGELARDIGMPVKEVIRILRNLEVEGLVVRYKPRGGWVRSWVGINWYYYGYKSERKQCVEMWERIARREAKATSKDRAFKRQIRKPSDG